MNSPSSTLMTIDVQVQIKCLPYDERNGKVVAHHWCSVDVGGLLVNAEIVNNDSAASNDVTVKKISVHVKQKDSHSRQAPNNCKVKEDWLAESFAINEHFGIIDFRFFVWLNVITVDSWNV